MEKEGTLLRTYDLKLAGKPLPSKSSPYSLYFKTLLVGDETKELSVGFRVTICGYKDNLFFEMNGPIHDSAITVVEAKLLALKYGLIESVSSGINHLPIWCDHDQIFDLVMERSVPEEENIALLLRDVQDIRKQLRSSIIVLVTETQVEFAYKLAMEAICSQTKIDLPVLKKSCSVCLEDDIDADQMLSVLPCRHEFCSQCVKRHVDVKLLEGNQVKCLHYRCGSTLTYSSCVNILTPKLKEMWQQKSKEDLIPVTDRVYCQNPRCSVLMSQIELSKHIGFRKFCVKCGEYFCINCKVLWHNNLSCNEYEKLYPDHRANNEKLEELANKKMWRQCRICQNMIELSVGCVSMRCRCGHQFCYQCGADAGYCIHGHGPFLPTEELDPPAAPVIVAFVTLIIIVLLR